MRKFEPNPLNTNDVADHLREGLDDMYFQLCILRKKKQKSLDKNRQVSRILVSDKVYSIGADLLAEPHLVSYIIKFSDKSTTVETKKTGHIEKISYSACAEASADPSSYLADEIISHIVINSMHQCLHALWIYLGKKKTKGLSYTLHAVEVGDHFVIEHQNNQFKIHVHYYGRGPASHEQHYIDVADPEALAKIDAILLSKFIEGPDGKMIIERHDSE